MANYLDQQLINILNVVNKPKIRNGRLKQDIVLNFKYSQCSIQNYLGEMEDDGILESMFLGSNLFYETKDPFQKRKPKKQSRQSNIPKEEKKQFIYEFIESAPEIEGWKGEEVADEVDMALELLNKKLEKLEKNNYIQRKSFYTSKLIIITEKGKDILSSNQPNIN